MSVWRSTSIISRKTGRSAVAASAYRSAEKLRSEHDGVTHDYCEKTNAINTAAYQSGERLHNDKNNTTHDYTRKRGVVHTEIILPETAPKEYADRATLWNAVERSEKRRDAQTARDIDMALPDELDRQEQITLVRAYVRENFVDRGMCADFAIHDKSDGNPHAHILLTTREVTETGFGKKNRDWNATAHLKAWRENWSNACNKELQSKGIDERIDHRTLKAQGIDRQPTIHIGVSAKHMEQRGIERDRANQNREIIKQNESKCPERIAEHLHELKENHFSLAKESAELQEISVEAGREMNIFRIKAEEITEEITERAGNIQSVKNRIDELKTERQSMGIFKNKKDIDRQIQQHERTYEQAIVYFKQKYAIDPEQAGEEIKRLDFAVASKRQLHEKMLAAYRAKRYEYF